MPSTVRSSLSVALLAIVLAGCGGSQAASTAPSPAQSKPAPASQSAAASAGASAASSASASAAAPADWDGVVAAAKREGKVNIITVPGDVYRQVFDEFQKKYGITVETLIGNGQADLVPKVSNERQAGQYQWDVAVHSPSAIFDGFKPAGALDPLRPALVLPEVTQGPWVGGFDAGWVDSGHALGYMFVSQVLWMTYVNRTVIPESQLNSIDQLWDSKWKGKMALHHSRVPSAGALVASSFLVHKGEDKLRSLFQSQQIALTQDRRQLGEWTLRGEYPIGLGVVPSVLSDFASRGLDIKNIKPLAPEDPAAWSASGSSGSVALFNRAPHPNAAKVLINWLLSKEGQTMWSQKTGYNSRRTDVPVVDPQGAVDPAKGVPPENRAPSDTEENYGVFLKAIAISKEVLK